MTGLTTAGAITATIEQAIAGDQAAFARLVAAYHADMARVAYGICGDADLASDAVQAAWVIAWRKLRSVREPEHLRAWLVAVAANEARHLVRRHGARVREIEIDACGAAVPVDDAGDIRLLDLGNALRRLSPDERALLALRYGAGLDSAEIGPVLGLTASGVRARLKRVVDRLRKELEDA